MAEPDLAADPITEFRWMRWVFVIVGFLCMVAGVIVVADPQNSLATIAVVIGIFLVIDGIVEILASLLSGRDGRALAVLIGAVSIVIGIILIRHPIKSVTAVAILVGLWLIVAGAVRLALVFDERQGRAWRFLVAIVEMIAGIVIVAIPGIGVATLALFIGIALILRGISLSTVGWLMHHMAKEAELPAHGPVAAT
jgi:uncharacterized membrane protein HdeD (DUF308 family)